MKKSRKWLIGILALLLVMQVIPLSRGSHTTPSEDAVVWDHPDTEALFIRACADCHSHQTEWPWYSRVAPVSWLLSNHVREGREHFNVSLSGSGLGDADEAAEELSSGEMPPKMYMLMHSDARLSAAEKDALIAGLEATFGKRDK